ncbi:MAG: L,D-transpeptidase [Pseudonocardiales bacterium]|nr:L,D-transpeptidase [Actinomycetota bacterium]
MPKRVAVLGALVAAVLAGCGADLAHDRTGPSHTTLTTAPVNIVAAPRTTAAPALKPTPTAKPAPKPKPNACAANTARQQVLVSVAEQHLWMCAASHLVYDAAVTTGAVDLPYDSTPTGSYQIQAKETDRTLTLISGDQYQVNYWIPFDAPLFGFHDSSWQSFPYGSPRYRTEGSHGCIHTPLAAMKFLYGWADIGAVVTIRP